MPTGSVSDQIFFECQVDLLCLRNPFLGSRKSTINHLSHWS